MPDFTLGVDLTDHGVRLAAVDSHGTVVARGAASGTADAVAVREAARSAVAAAKGTVGGVGVAMPTAFESVPGPIAAALRDATSCEIVPIAAGNAAALAEQWTGAARGMKQVVTFAIGEHVSAGVLLNGEPWLGAHGFAASAGWLAMNPVERDDYRRLGGLEAEIAIAGIVRRFVWRIKSGDESAVAKKVKGDFAKISAADIFQGSRGGDGVSISIVRDTARYIGMAAANIATLFDPEIIILGGLIPDAGDVMLETIKTECSRRLHPQLSERLRIALSTLGPDAVAIGAARAGGRVG